MRNLTNKVKEQTSIHAIQGHILQKKLNIESFLNWSDKEASFDGHLQIKSGASESKKEFLKNVDCQVKSTEVRKLSGETTKMRFTKEDLDNYYRQGGVLLLLIEIIDYDRKKIFYKQLLPMELYNITKELENGGEKKPIQSRRIWFRSLEETNLYDVCIGYIKELDKQPKQLIENQITSIEYDKFVFTSTTANNQNNEFNVLGHDFFRYGVKDQVHYPLDIVTVDKVIIGGIKPFIIKDQNDKYKVHELFVKEELEKGDLRVFDLEECLKLTINKKKSTIKYHSYAFNNVKSQIKVLTFLIDFLNSKEICYQEGEKSEDHELVGFSLNTKDEKLIDNSKWSLSKIKELEFVFNQLNISTETKIKDEVTYNNINSLAKIFIEAEFDHLKTSDNNNASFTTFTLGGSKVLLFYNPFDEDQYIDPFGKEMDKITMLSTREEFKHVKLTPYLKINATNLAKAININLDKIDEKISEMLNQSNIINFSNAISEFSLECIKAYDLCKNEKLLLIAMKMLDFLVDGTEDLRDKESSIINRIQAKKRLTSSIDDKDYEMLFSLKDKTTKDNCILIFCVNVLLENYREADYIEKIFPSEILSLHDYPIYKLYLDQKTN